MKTLSVLIILMFCALPLSATDKVLPKKPYTTLGSDPGFVTMNELNFGFGLGDTGPDYSKSFVGFTTTNGYLINKNFTVAGGTGFLVYNGGTLIPLFLDLRYKMNIDPVTPYTFADGGFMINPKDVNGGSKMFLNLGVGAQYAFSQKLAANLGTGFFVQYNTHRDTFINIKAGVTYKF
jgi:hypothetical protein